MIYLIILCSISFWKPIGVYASLCNASHALSEIKIISIDELQIERISLDEYFDLIIDEGIDGWYA